MRIIRDTTDTLFMVPLMIDWGIRRCNVRGCTEKPNTIIVDIAPDVPVIGMCEKHYSRAASTPGDVTYTFDFDDFDAFAEVTH